MWWVADASSVHELLSIGPTGYDTPMRSRPATCAAGDEMGWLVDGTGRLFLTGGEGPGHMLDLYQLYSLFPEGIHVKREIYIYIYIYSKTVGMRRQWRHLWSPFNRVQSACNRRWMTSHPGVRCSQVERAFLAMHECGERIFIRGAIRDMAIGCVI